jgi:hypothetical protein
MTVTAKRTSRSKLRDDIRVVFDRISDDALLDDMQLAALAGRSAATIKRWRRLGKTPPVVMLNGLPRVRAEDARPWLRGHCQTGESQPQICDYRAALSDGAFGSLRGR